MLDVGLRRDPITEIDTLTTPDLLSFAGIEPVTVRALPLELQVAEKLHAYSRTHEGARPSTRVKDLVDLALIVELSPLKAATLRDAIEATFARRATHDPPAQLPFPPADWLVPFRRLAETVGVTPSLEGSHAAAAALLDPILGGRITQGHWNPEAQCWIAEGL